MIPSEADNEPQLKRMSTAVHLAAEMEIGIEVGVFVLFPGDVVVI